MLSKLPILFHVNVKGHMLHTQFIHAADIPVLTNLLSSMQYQLYYLAIIQFLDNENRVAMHVPLGWRCARSSDNMDMNNVGSVKSVKSVKFGFA